MVQISIRINAFPGTVAQPPYKKLCGTMVQPLYKKTPSLGPWRSPHTRNFAEPWFSLYMQKKLPGLGSNQGLQLQRLTCYRYTTGQ